jgi:hypothetical protein
LVVDEKIIKISLIVITAQVFGDFSLQENNQNIEKQEKAWNFGLF